MPLAAFTRECRWLSALLPSSPTSPRAPRAWSPDLHSKPLATLAAWVNHVKTDRSLWGAREVWVFLVLTCCRHTEARLFEFLFHLPVLSVSRGSSSCQTALIYTSSSFWTFPPLCIGGEIVPGAFMSCFFSLKNPVMTLSSVQLGPALVHSHQQSPPPFPTPPQNTVLYHSLKANKRLGAYRYRS